MSVAGLERMTAVSVASALSYRATQVESISILFILSLKHTYKFNLSLV